ncbi:hypothetical protein ACEPAF_5353 [Sanghuangporus sanghuang]
MATSQQFRNMDGATPQLNARQEAARHRNPQPCLRCKQYRQGVRIPYLCVEAVTRVSDAYNVHGRNSAYLDSGEASLATALGLLLRSRDKGVKQDAGLLQDNALAIGSPTSTSTDVDQHSHNTESSDGRMNSASPTRSTWLGGPFYGSPIAIDLPLQYAVQRSAGSLQDSAVFSLPFAAQVGAGQGDELQRLCAVSPPQSFQGHSFGHSDQQSFQAETAQYTSDHAWSFQGDSEIPEPRRGFMHQAASSGLESRAPMGYYEQENLPQTMHNSQYPPTSGHITLLHNTDGERALVPVQQHVGHCQVVPNDQMQTAPLSPVDLDVMANCDWDGLDVTDEFIDKLIAACDHLGIDM